MQFDEYDTVMLHRNECDAETQSLLMSGGSPGHPSGDCGATTVSTKTPHSCWGTHKQATWQEIEDEQWCAQQILQQTCDARQGLWVSPGN